MIQRIPAESKVNPIFLHGLDCVVVKILCVWMSLLPRLLVLGSDEDDNDE